MAKMLNFILLLSLLYLCAKPSEQTDAIARQFWRPGGIPSMFSTLRLQNTACTVDGESGTCLSDSDCKSRQGFSVGTCGTGRSNLVCCNMKFTCGGKTAKNETMFVNPSYPAGENGTNTCQVTIQNVPGVCQLRLGNY